jgi:hypothetical protein
VLFNNDRLSHWCVGAVLGWTISLLLLFIPVFHLLLGFPVTKILISSAIGCAVQLAITPWLFAARATGQNPSGQKARAGVAMIVGYSLTCLLFFYYVQRSWPRDPHSNEFRAILFGTTIVAALFAFGMVSRSRGSSGKGS